jgi:hypothetical protein
MQDRRGERGEGRMGTMFALAVLAVLIYLGFKVIPVMINTYAFRDFMEQEARFAALRNKDEELRKRLVVKAQELDLPVDAKSVRMNRSPSHFDVQITYTVPIETPLYTYQWVFQESARAPLF